MNLFVFISRLLFSSLVHFFQRKNEADSVDEHITEKKIKSGPKSWMPSRQVSDVLAGILPQIRFFGGLDESWRIFHDEKGQLSKYRVGLKRLNRFAVGTKRKFSPGNFVE